MDANNKVQSLVGEVSPSAVVREVILTELPDVLKETNDTPVQSRCNVPVFEYDGSLPSLPMDDMHLGL